MRIVGVIDLMGGVVVRAVAGRREAYRPIVSPLCAGSAPPDVARALLSLGVGELYLADLDAIAGAEPDWAALAALRSLTRGFEVSGSRCEDLSPQPPPLKGEGEPEACRGAFAFSRAVLLPPPPLGEGGWGGEVFAATPRNLEPTVTVPLWIDAGVREPSRGARLARLGIDRVVVGLESVPDPATLARLVDDLGERVVFSLDLREGVPVGAWPSPDPFAIAEEAIRLGVRRVLVLDLARVGVRGGPGTNALCARLVAAHPGIEVSAGGGIRGRADLESLRSVGVAAKRTYGPRACARPAAPPPAGRAAREPATTAGRTANRSS